ncbi:hypothetical protein R5R35_010959 [Gryllus longicercus]|uniref:Eukaryotic translation initiation factor 3 subunit J n=1 Tax=Gryllus longicercus TaxID=2509291 RepID=A0AAN9Z7J3_9ORTH
MDEEWDAEGKELPTPAAVGANKWEGEDEEEEVKESWEDEEEEEEKKDVEKQEPPKATQLKKPKKIRAEKIEEKERKLQEELERKAKLREQMTPAELQAEKLRQQQLQEEADLRVAMETFGTAESSGTGIDAMNPTTEEEFEELQKALSKKINLYNKSTHFPLFAEELIRNICVSLTSNDLKKLKTTVENMFLEKSKLEKGDKAKKNKGKGKVKLRVEGENVTSATLVNDYYNEYDDFDDFM